MYRFAAVALVLFAGSTRADTFDQLSSSDLAKLLATDGAQAVAEVTSSQLAAAGEKSPGLTSAVLVLRTKEGRLTKLIVQPGMQKVGPAKHPMILIDRYATFKDGEERATVVKGAGVPLYPGQLFNADLGQVVPPLVGGDLEATTATELSKLELKPVGNAKLYLVTKMPKLVAGATTTFVPGGVFEPRFFNGSYLLVSDGRRSGTLTLDVDEASGEATGSYYSDKDGRKYDVKGKVGNPRHQVSFGIKMPQAQEQFQGFMFTGDGKAIAGTAKLQDREVGFYATRIEGK